MDKFPIFKTEHKKMRVGKMNDGGYVCCDIPNIKYDILLSGGIETDISFEEILLRKYLYLSCIAFDGTIQSLPKENRRINFVKKNIGSECSDSLTDLKEYIQPYSNIFMKMDIEGGEYQLFSSLSDIEIQKIAQLVIEVHFGTGDLVSQRLKNTHYLVHFHPNNASVIDQYGMPAVFELTYVRKDLCQKVFQSTDSIPNSELDMKNDRSRPDILYRNNMFILENKVVYKFSTATGRVETYLT
jgi:hypothetical protein